MGQQQPPMLHTGMVLMGVAFELIVFSVVGIFFAIGNYYLAKRLGKSTAWWVILSIIPGVNFIFVYYVGYQVVYGILDRLPPKPAVSERLELS